MQSYTIKDTKLIFRNFAGNPTPFNKEGGKRTFSMLLDEDIAIQLTDAGFNVKPLKKRDDDPDAEQMYHLSVKVSYKNRPPRIVMIDNGKRIPVTEDTVEGLDYMDIERADVCITPYNWEMNGRSGTAAYLKLMYVTLESNELDRMYGIEDDEPADEGSYDEPPF